MPPIALLICTAETRRNRMREELAAVGWRVHAGTNIQDALRQLKETQVTAVFSDETLRGASPAGFLAWTRREQPKAQFFLFGNPQDWRGNLRPDGFLSWPPIRSELPVAPGTIVPTEAELIGDDVPLSGTTGLMSLEQLLEMLKFSGRDAVVRLHGGRGFVHLQDGTVLHASHQMAGTMQTGIAALAELLTLTDTDFAVEEFRKPTRTTINRPVAGAISEAAQAADERRRDDALVKLLLSEQPRLAAVAVGYHLAQQPDAGHGDADSLFELAVSLLNGNRGLLGAAPQSLLVSGERQSVAVVVFADTKLLAASVRGKAGAVLLRLLEKAVAATVEKSSAG